LNERNPPLNLRPFDRPRVRRLKISRANLTHCNPTARFINLGYASSLSNIKDNALSILNDFTNPFNSFTIIPNPATENTSINLNLNTTSLTNITVFDLTGRLVQILKSSAITAGSHTFLLGT